MSRHIKIKLLKTTKKSLENSQDKQHTNYMETLIIMTEFSFTGQKKVEQLFFSSGRKELHPRILYPAILFLRNQVESHFQKKNKTKSIWSLVDVPLKTG